MITMQDIDREHGFYQSGWFIDSACPSDFIKPGRYLYITDKTNSEAPPFIPLQ